MLLLLKVVGKLMVLDEPPLHFPELFIGHVLEGGENESFHPLPYFQ
jgi:hypothetical protein